MARHGNHARSRTLIRGSWENVASLQGTRGVQGYVYARPSRKGDTVLYPYDSQAHTPPYYTIGDACAVSVARQARQAAWVRQSCRLGGREKMLSNGLLKVFGDRD